MTSQRSLCTDDSLDPSWETEGSYWESLEEIWPATRGDSRVCVAILDGPVDLTHESLRNANITSIEAHPSAIVGGPASRHGTHIASIIFADSGGPIRGIAPGCKGIAIEVFTDSESLTRPTCSQRDLASAINRALDCGADVINISAGELSDWGSVDDRLAAAIQRCAESGVLVVAAAGEGGCCDPQFPSAFHSVLAVGAAHQPDAGRCTAWLDPEYEQCITAPSHDIPGALVGGGWIRGTGSSYGTAIASGSAALLLSLQFRDEGRAEPEIIRRILVASARQNAHHPEGTLDLRRAARLLTNHCGGEARTLADGRTRSGYSPLEVDPAMKLTISSWALRTKFKGVERLKFGTVDVLLPDSQYFNSSDLTYPVSPGRAGMRIIPASDESTMVLPDGTSCSGWQVIDDFLRQQACIEKNDPIYAMLSYIHPEEYKIDVAALPLTSKLYIGHRHIGAYLGKGRTTHALSSHVRWRGNSASDMALNVDRHPANVQIISLYGTPSATLNRNAFIVDSIISARAKVPVETDTINCRTIDLPSMLQYYRDIIRQAEYLDDLAWYTNCSVHKTIVVNVFLNVPHNEMAFSEIFGAEGTELWSEFQQCYEQAVGHPFSAELETHFTPLWKLEGMPATAVRPLSLGEYNRFYAARDEGRLETYNGRRPLQSDDGLAWPLETLVDVILSFINMYTDFGSAGGLIAAGEVLLVRHLVKKRLRIAEPVYTETVRPIIRELLVAESLTKGSSKDAVKWLDGATAELQNWLERADRIYGSNGSATLSEFIGQCIVEAKEQAIHLLMARTFDRADAMQWLSSAMSAEPQRLRAAITAVWARDGLFSSPAIFHKLALDRHHKSSFVDVRTVCTVVDQAYVAPLDYSEHYPFQRDVSGSGRIQTEDKMDQLGDAEIVSARETEVTLPAVVMQPPSGEVYYKRLAEASGVVPSAEDENEGAAGQLVYALGQIEYGFPSRGRRDSFRQRLDDAADPDDPHSILTHLDANPADAASLAWTLALEGVPLYSLQPVGPFAGEVYAMLRRFLHEQLDEGVERVSIPGTVLGMARHRTGIDLPVIAPELRGMYSWTTEALVSSLLGPPGNGVESTEAASTRASGGRTSSERANIQSGVTAFLERVYYELRNPGVHPHHRALNYAATNAFEVGRVYGEAIRANMELDTIEVEASTFGPRPGNCWDVKLVFFFPDRPPQAVRRLYRFTVSVEDVVPATVGPMRSWSIR